MECGEFEIICETKPQAGVYLKRHVMFTNYVKLFYYLFVLGGGH